jgi:hypothetical protein
LVRRAVDQAVEAATEAYGAFECNICFEVATEPVVTLCGHMYCWPCLYRWLAPPLGRTHCPVCKGLVDATKVIPLYGRRDQPSAQLTSSPCKPPDAAAAASSPDDGHLPPHERGLEPVPCRPRSLRTDSSPPLAVRALAFAAACPSCLCGYTESSKADRRLLPL